MEKLETVPKDATPFYAVGYQVCKLSYMDNREVTFYSPVFLREEDAQRYLDEVRRTCGESGEMPRDASLLPQWLNQYSSSWAGEDERGSGVMPYIQEVPICNAYCPPSRQEEQLSWCGICGKDSLESELDHGMCKSCIGLTTPSDEEVAEWKKDKKGNET